MDLSDVPFSLSCAGVEKMTRNSDVLKHDRSVMADLDESCLLPAWALSRVLLISTE